jgi:ATP-dependent DNA helicase RecQ
MVYGLNDVVNQRRMIDESPAGEEFKQVMRGKLDALLALAEATDCRRVRLLSYFGQSYMRDGVAHLRCGNCDNCQHPPDIWDGTEAARMLLSTIYRIQQQSGITFGAGHIMDVLRGKTTQKIEQFGHQSISTFGIGNKFSEIQLRGVLRQLLAIGALGIDGQAFNTLFLTDLSRAVLKGELKVQLRASVSSPAERKVKRTTSLKTIETQLDETAQHRFAQLKAWRAEVAKSHNLPAYVIFHDATLAAIAQAHPASLEELQNIAGIGVKKLEAYGQEVLRIIDPAA